MSLEKCDHLFLGEKCHLSCLDFKLSTFFHVFKFLLLLCLLKLCRQRVGPVRGGGGEREPEQEFVWAEGGSMGRKAESECESYQVTQAEGGVGPGGGV